MGMFDFFRGKAGPVAGQTLKASMDPTMDDPITRSLGNTGELMQAPQMQKQPGFFGRMMQPDGDGIGFRDRAMMAAMALGGEGGTALSYKRLLKKDATDKAQREAQNKLLKESYDPETGRFDMGKYLAGSLGSGDSDGGGALPDMDIMGDMGSLLKLADHNKPRQRVLRGQDGFYAVNDDAGSANLIHPFEDEEDAPSGYRWKADKSGLELIPGYAEGVDRLAGVRRDAIVSRPMPARPRAGGARSGIPAPPPGFRPVGP